VCRFFDVVDKFLFNNPHNGIHLFVFAHDLHTALELLCDSGFASCGF